MAELTSETPRPQRLLVGSRVDQVNGDVNRGMTVVADDGSVAGSVAAVVQSAATGAVTHLLLGQTPPTAVYRLIPIGLVHRLEGACVRLRVTQEQISALPVHDPAG